LAAAYCGAYAAGHIATMGHATEDHAEDFKFLYSREIKRMKVIASQMPSKMSVRTMISRSPATVWGLLAEN